MRSDVVGVERLLGVVNPAAIDHELELVVARILHAVESFLLKIVPKTTGLWKKRVAEVFGLRNTALSYILAFLNIVKSMLLRVQTLELEASWILIKLNYFNETRNNLQTISDCTDINIVGLFKDYKFLV